jgi:hypothetical protein
LRRFFGGFFFRFLGLGSDVVGHGGIGEGGGVLRRVRRSNPCETGWVHKYYIKKVSLDF